MLKFYSLFFFSGNTDDCCSGRLKYLFVRFFTDNKKIMHSNLELFALKLERNKSHLMFNETCFNNDIPSQLHKKASIAQIISIRFLVN